MRHFLFFSLLKRFAVPAGLPLILFADVAIGATATPKYIQGNYAVPQTSQSVTVPYKSAQTAGNLNVVIVGWSYSSSTVSSVKDSKGTLFTKVIGPTVTGLLSQSIYYLKNIPAASANANAVTVTFSNAANFPDIRILEYSGIDPSNPVDVFAGATGSGTTSNSGSLSTTFPTDLLVGANTVQMHTTAVGSGFTQRLLTTPDGDVAEDRVVTAVGSYGATASVASGGWVMQMVAFRAATLAGGSSSLKVSWNADAPTSNPATNTTGYRLYWGTTSGVYTSNLNAGNTLTATISNLAKGTTYFSVVKAYNSSGLESPPSNQISFVAP